MDNTSCAKCKYSYGNNKCSEAVKHGCEGCPMNIDDTTCKCTTHRLVGEDCPDYTPIEDA